MRNSNPSLLSRFKSWSGSSGLMSYKFLSAKILPDAEFQMLISRLFQSSGLMSYKFLLVKILPDAEFQMLTSRLFQSVSVAGKKFCLEERDFNFFGISCSVRGFTFSN